MDARSDGHSEEVEWQLDAHDLRPVLRWLGALVDGEGAAGVTVAPARTVNQVDTYVDTKDGKLNRAGYAVRLRRAARRPPEATLKSLAPSSSTQDGLKVRLELEQAVDVHEASALALADGPVAERVRALVGPRRLVPLFEVRTRRRVFPLSVDGAPTAEVVVDETAIGEPGGRTLSRLRRVEVEASAATRELVEPFVEQLRATCGLRPAALSKYEAGLVAVGIDRAEPEGFGSTDIGTASTIGAVGLAALRRELAAMLAKEPGARVGDDLEDLHAMRVASRRLRAALALFADVLPAGTAELRAELAWVGQTIGSVRDLDVQLQQLDGWIEAVPEADREALARVRTLLVDARVEARRGMLEALDSPRYGRFVRRFGTLLRKRTGARTPLALVAAPELVDRRHRALRKAARRVGADGDADAYHRLRIAGKRFRYTLEFLAEVYPRSTKPLVRRATALQDVLGEYQDANVAIVRLRRLATERGDELGPPTVFAMGEVAERYRNAIGDIRGDTRATFAKLEGKRWKELRQRMEAERIKAAPVATLPVAPPAV